MRKTILTVTLNPAIDKTVQVTNFHTGSDFRENSVHLSAGGKGLNVSRALKNLGEKTLATGLLGGFSGEFIRETLNAERLDNHFFFFDGETRTNLTVIDPAAKKITRVLERGPAVDKQGLKAFQKKYASLLPKSHCVIFSGSIPPNVPDNIYAQLIALAKRKNIRTVLDASGRPLALGLKARPFLAKPNLNETESLLGRPLKTAAALKSAIKYFHNIGIKIIIISLGAQGAVASDTEKILRAQAPRIACKNNVGCGDALLAGFIAAFDQGKSLRECLAFGVACGTANLLNVQPGCVERKAILKVLREVKISQVR